MSAVMSGMASHGHNDASAGPMTTMPGIGDVPGRPVGLGSTTTPYDIIPTIRVTGKGKMMAVKVQMLDDGLAIFQVQAKALGRVLFEQVCRQLSLLEADYFGLEYSDANGTSYWLDLSKPMKEQMVLNALRDPLLRFCVKFYPPDPAQLEEEYTRFLFCLQIKRDMAQGHLMCNDKTAGLLASYVVQAESGDYAPEDYPDSSYLSSYKFVPHQSEELERLIMENHKKHVGQTPAEADLNLLETARRCEFYGMKMTPAKDHEGVPLNLTVAHMGLIVFQKVAKINTFSWAKIRKLSFKRRKFLVKLHPEGCVSIGRKYYKDQVEFFFDGRDECKNFWKKCVEHHGFFRCSSVKRIPRHRPKVMSRGSSFRYVGKTQKEMMDFVRGNFVKRQSFQRSQSFRQPLHSVLGSHPNVGSALDRGGVGIPHPLLPIGDALSGAQSMGSISLSHGGRGSLGGGGTLSRRTGDSVASGLRGAHSPVSPSHTDPGGDLPEYEERRHEECSRPGDQMQMKRGGAGHHYELPETPSTSKQTTSVTSSPQRAATTDDDEFSSSPRRTWAHRNVAPAGRGAMEREASLDHGEYILSENADVLRSPGEETEMNGNHSPSPPPPPPPIMDEEGNDTSITGLVDRVLSPLTNHAQETRNSIINNDEHRSRAGSWQNNVVRANGNVGYGELNGDLEVPDHQEGRKKRMTSKTYFIVKELLMTERTYRKDLEVIEVWLRDELMSNDDETLDDGIPRHVLDSLFEIHEPIFDFHSLLLKDIEERFRTWDSTSGRHPHHHNHTRLASSGGSRIGDVFHNSMHKMTPLYVNYLNGHRDVMEGLEYALKDSITFDQIIRDFEATEVCYLPLFTFVLKPLHRLTHYQALLRRLVDHYPIDHPDLTSCKAALTLMTDLVARVGEVLPTSDNYAKLVELQRELKGFDALIQPERHFIREGSLQKLSRKGYQQRMFFLFSDVLLYAARVTQPRLHFKIHGVIPLRDVMVEEADRRSTASHSFTIYANNRALLVAASTADEKRNWLQDFSRAIADAREKPETSLQYLSLKSASSSEDVGGGDANNAGDRGNGAPAVNQRSNTSVHVCWHRNTSVSSLDLRLAANSQLSGYLLRKFKSSSGWQKLWVVFTNFCLFFYKTDEDPFPLASLPLLSYRVTTPSPQDEIAKEHVFKLQFKNHVYFFRAESEYTFNRWMDVIGNATNRNFDVTSEILRSSPM